MKQEFSFEPLKGELKIHRDPGGQDYVRLDAQSSQYYLCREALAKCTMVTETSKILPREAYLFPPGSYFVNDLKIFEDLVVSMPTMNYPIHLMLNRYLPVIKITVEGEIEKNGEDYAMGSSVEFSTGILFIGAIATWNSWRKLKELWVAKVWEQVGLDYR